MKPVLLACRECYHMNPAFALACKRCGALAPKYGELQPSPVRPNDWLFVAGVCIGVVLFVIVMAVSVLRNPKP